MPLLSGAEPFAADRGPMGALLCHGFTGTPQSMRPWAEFLADAGLTVRLPRLPGHGTRWQEMNRTRWQDWYATDSRALDELRERCTTVVVCGLSMGGTLALRLAEERPQDVDGLVLVNPSLHTENSMMRLLPVLKLLVPSLSGIGSDIKKPGVTELAYDRTPLRALASLAALWTHTKADLGKVQAPVLLFRSTEDHVVEPSNAAYLREKLGTAVEERLCPDSYHVAALDNDAPAIFEGSLEFARRLAAARPAAAAVREAAAAAENPAAAPTARDNGHHAAT